MVYLLSLFIDELCLSCLQNGSGFELENLLVCIVYDHLLNNKFVSFLHFKNKV
jgi:hypothetical protein